MSQGLTAQPHTLLDLGIERLVTLASALDYDAKSKRLAVGLFQRLAASWASARVGAAPRWRSDITDDHSPFEFSLAIDHLTPELRFLTETQAEQPSIRSNWDAAQTMNRELARDFDLDLDRLSRVEDLFVPAQGCPRFAMWHAVCLRRGSAPDFKIYLNPQARGIGNAKYVVETAMARLGFQEAHACLPPILAQDELCYFSLDLSASPEARVKVYVAHHQATCARIELAVSTAIGRVPGRAAEFCRAMAESPGPFEARPVLTCLSFAAGSVRPTVATVHFPVRSYAENDSVVKERVLRYMKRTDAALYRSAVEAFAQRPPAERSGMQTYVSLRLSQNGRLTVYLAPEAYDSRVHPASGVHPTAPPCAPTHHTSSGH